MARTGLLCFRAAVSVGVLSVGDVADDIGAATATKVGAASSSGVLGTDSVAANSSVESIGFTVHDLPVACLEEVLEIFWERNSLTSCKCEKTALR